MKVRDIRRERPAIAICEIWEEEGHSLSDAPAVRELAKVWKRTNDGELPTFPVDKPVRQIDHILVHPPTRWRVIETRVLDDAVASDHRSIFSVLELATE